MSKNKEQPVFEIRSQMEQKPFESSAVQSFFTKWCEINDSIRPKIVPREEWELKKKTGLLEKRPDGMQDLLIPADLQLWEMVEVMETIDHDTFADNPKRQKEKAGELFKLGKTFSNAGIYIAQRLGVIPRGKEIAEDLAKDFYNYGQSLISRKKSEEVDVDKIGLQVLTPAEVEEVDRFLAGESLYAARQARAEKAAQEDPSKKDKIFEDERRKTIAQFFRVAEKSSSNSAFLRKVNRGIEKQVETPYRELTASIFRRGMELLRKNMPFDKLPRYIKSMVLHWEVGETTLRQALNTDQLKLDLEAVRQTGNLFAIGEKEREIADLIQLAVSELPYESSSNNPSEMVASQQINCVGASMLGGSLLSEVGIKYLLGSVPEHSILVLVRSDGKVEWRDMLNPIGNGELVDEEIEGKSKTGTSLTVQDIIAYANNPSPEGLGFGIKGTKYRERFSHVKKSREQFLTVFPPEIGQKIQALTNTGFTLVGLGFYQVAIEVFRQVVTDEPKYGSAYYGLGVAYHALGQDREALRNYRQAIVIDPAYAHSYRELGDILAGLGRESEALEAYKKFILLADEESDAQWIRVIKAEIEVLEKGKELEELDA